MKILFVFAHPDDESFSSGGTIAQLSKNHQIKLITATKGETGSVGNPPLTTPDKLGKVRKKEHQKAAKILGISEIFYLGHLDGEVAQVSRKKLTQQIGEILEREQPDIVVTFDVHGGSNHPDHKAVSKAATLAFEKHKAQAKKHVRLYHTAQPQSLLKIYAKSGLSYTAFGKVKGVADKQITTIIDISETYPLKLKALKHHKTQHQDVERFLKRAKLVNLKFEYFKLISENHLV